MSKKTKATAPIVASKSTFFMNAMQSETSHTLVATDYKEPQLVCIEGNGSRPSHQGDGYKEGDTMYTLNSTEHHAVCYRGDAITSPVNASNPQVGDPCHTLTNDSRNYVVIENHPADSRVKLSEDNICQTLSSRMGTGGGNVPIVVEQFVLELDTTIKICGGVLLHDWRNKTSADSS